MKRLLLAGITVALLWLVLSPQWRSFERMGARRFQVLSAAPTELLVGVVWPTTLNQDGMVQGVQLARDEINRAGLANGLPVRLVVRDPEGDWERGKHIAAEFADTPAMSAVIGYYDDAEAIKASVLYESSRLLHIVTGANSTTMTALGYKYIVRTIVSSDKIARSLTGMLWERGYRKYAIVWEDDAYGADLAYQMRVLLDTLDAEMVYEQSYSRERADFRPMVNELKGIDADVVVFAGLEPWAGDFLRLAHGVGMKAPIVGAFSDTPMMRDRSGAGLEGSMYFEFYDPASGTPRNAAFVRAFRARYGKPPDSWAAQGYDALHILAKAVASSRSVNPLDLAYAVRFMEPCEGANGRYQFDSRGEIEDKPIFINAFRNGAPVTIQTSRPAPALAGEPSGPGQ